VREAFWRVRATVGGVRLRVGSGIGLGDVGHGGGQGGEGGPGVDRDRHAVRAAGAAILSSGWTGTPEAVANRVRAAAAAGITHLVYTPAGPDIAGELEAFAGAYHDAARAG